MSKLARALALVAVVAAMNLAGMTAVVQAHATDQANSQDARRPPAQRQLSKARHQRRVSSPAQAAADTAHRRLLAQERSSIPIGAPTPLPSPMRPAKPSGQPGWLTPALSGLAAVLALVAGVAVLTARRANRTQHTEQTV